MGWGRVMVWLWRVTWLMGSNPDMKKERKKHDGLELGRGMVCMYILHGKAPTYSSRYVMERDRLGIIIRY